MAKFGEEINYPGIDVKNFFRIPVALQEDDYLINEGRNTIIKVHDKQLHHSWTLTHPHSFTCPLVFDDEESSIFCVMDNNVLMRWSLEDENLENSSKYEFQESIFCLLPTPGLKLTILFSSGKFLEYASISNTPEPKGKCVNDDIIWADSVKYKSGIIIVYLTGSRKFKNYTLHHICTMDDSEHQYNSYDLGFEELTLKDWCLDKFTHSFLCLCSNGEILSYDLIEKTQSSILKLPGISEEQLLAVYSVDLNHLVVLKSSPHSKDSCLEVWDSKFKALKTSKIIKTASPHCVQLYFLKSSILVFLDGELVKIPLFIEKSTLASAIGKSLLNATGVKESSWKKGKLELINPPDIEEMDTSESADRNSAEVIVQRLMTEGSNYLNLVTESQLVSVLSLVIRHKQKGESTQFDPNFVLNMIFSASFTDMFLLRTLKKLNLGDAMLTLETLLDILDDSPVKSSKSPSDLQIFSWIIFVLQTHMEALLLSKDKNCRKLLTRLDKQLSEKMEEYEDFQSLQHLFSVMKMENVLPKKQTGLYSVETIDL